MYDDPIYKEAIEEQFVLEDVDKCKMRIIAKEKHIEDEQNELRLLYKQLYETYVYTTHYGLTHTCFEEISSQYKNSKDPDYIEKSTESLYDFKMFEKNIFYGTFVKDEDASITDMRQTYAHGTIDFVYKNERFSFEMPFKERFLTKDLMNAMKSGNDDLFALKITYCGESNTETRITYSFSDVNGIIQDLYEKYSEATRRLCGI
jgi:hypothetical protein